MNIGVYIENGGLNTLNVSDSMTDQLIALDQAESHFVARISSLASATV